MQPPAAVAAGRPKARAPLPELRPGRAGSKFKGISRGETHHCGGPHKNTNPFLVSWTLKLPFKQSSMYISNIRFFEPGVHIEMEPTNVYAQATVNFNWQPTDMESWSVTLIGFGGCVAHVVPSLSQMAENIAPRSHRVQIDTLTCPKDLEKMVNLLGP